LFCSLEMIWLCWINCCFVVWRLRCNCQTKASDTRCFMYYIIISRCYTLLQVTLKPCFGGQTFVGMIGYCTKDSGKASYQVRVHNISPHLLSQGRTEHRVLLTSFDDDKNLSTRRIFWTNVAASINDACGPPSFLHNTCFSTWCKAESTFCLQISCPSTRKLIS